MKRTQLPNALITKIMAAPHTPVKHKILYFQVFMDPTRHITFVWYGIKGRCKNG